MCDHCSTYKDVIERLPKGCTNDFGRGSPAAIQGTSSSESGCCSWRKSCCGGGCCGQAQSCCSTGQHRQILAPEKPTIGYGSDARTRIRETMDIRNGTLGTSGATVEMTRCTYARQKVPMCYGGECGTLSAEKLVGADAEKCENDVSQPTPVQSQR
ncbi:hypothetical protein KM043_006686 [Ampulex compressa]|nr:hypothetical protein KM043_006686 [Ampulex compressa]